MKVVVWTDESGKEEFEAKKISTEVELIFIENLSGVSDYGFADAFFLLKEEFNKEEEKLFNGKPVFINSVVNTLKEINPPKNFNRINGWPGFINRETWEIATRNESLVKDIFEKLEWKYITVADEPGLVSARIISMIINEAYFALGDGVSTKEEIDVAMKLGTNYPYGPFEWSKKIGLNKIHNLLEELSKDDSRYNIASKMKTDLANK